LALESHQIIISKNRGCRNEKKIAAKKLEKNEQKKIQQPLANLASPLIINDLL
jgi:hypothetical protein